MEINNGNEKQDNESATPFNNEEIERYARQIVLKDIGGFGQQKLKSAKVFVVGAGGLGCPLLLYLAAAGVGVIGLVDDDVVALSNLQRQILFNSRDVGQAKTSAAGKHLLNLNHNLSVNLHNCRLTKDNAAALLADYDVVADGSDNFITRLIVADTCEILRKPLISGAVGPMNGMVSTFKPYEQGPAYRDLFPTSSQDEQPCSVFGVLGALCGLVGSSMAVEVIREIVGFGQGLNGKLLLIDMFHFRHEIIDIMSAKKTVS